MSAQPKLVTLGIGLAITFAIGTAIGMIDPDLAYAAPRPGPTGPRPNP